MLGRLVGKNKSKIGFMPQDIAVINEFTIKEMIYFFGAIYGLDKNKIKDQYNFLKDLFELPDGDHFLRNCSGGEKRRASLAVCLIHQPKLLVLDEPTVGIDSLLRRKIWDFFEALVSSGETTVFITTHYIEEAKQANCVRKNISTNTTNIAPFNVTVSLLRLAFYEMEFLWLKVPTLIFLISSVRTA